MKSANAFVAVALGVGLLTACGGPLQTALETGGTKTVTVVASAPSTATVAAPAPVTVTATPAGPQSTISTDGTYLVGTDIMPGIYRMPGGSHCYWARLSSLNTSDIIDNNNSSGPQTVEIQPSDRAFISHGCGTWTLAQAAATTAPLMPTQQAAAPVGGVPGTDAQGFVNGLRCPYKAALVIRTAQSNAVVCADDGGDYMYRGLRLVDGARIDIPGAVPTENGFTVTNNGTRYDITPLMLTITSGGAVDSEPAIGSP